MDLSIDWMMNTLELCLSKPPETHESLTSTTPALSRNSNVFMQSVNVGNQETEFSASSNTLWPSYPSQRNDYGSTVISHDEHQLSGIGMTKPEPLRRKCHAKSRRGCHNCKKRRVKVLPMPVRRTKD